MMRANKLISDKKVFNQMFKSFRANGFKARQNFTCCQSCGWAEMEDIAGDNENIVFYHNQDNDAFGSDGYLEGTIYLAWNGDGSKIKQIAEDFGYTVDWDGTEGKRIGIVPNLNARELA